MTIYSEFSHEKTVIVHSYVKLPEGMSRLDDKFKGLTDLPGKVFP